MERLLAPLILGLLSIGAQCTEEQNAMVAFVCHRPAMFLREDGSWQKDDTTDCLTEPEKILDYCRKVYPHLDIRNVMEASKKARIPSWCGFGRDKCSATKHTYTVRPFRCWVGAFQSEALLVPEHCLFDHIYEPKSCKSFQEWNSTARASCNGRGMDLQSFGILQPCGIDRFNGVEYVCCPAEEDSEEDEVDVFIEEELKSFTTTPAPTTTTSTSITTTTTPKIEEVDLDDEAIPTAKSIYKEYLDGPNSRFTNEHEFFLKAKSDLQKHHHDKVTKMMKEWANARQKVLELKEVDPKAADQLNQEITSRFQRTYEALEQEGNAEKQQISAMHQMRIESDLNAKKRNAMQRYMDELTKEDPESPKLLKTLKHYIKMEQKDRLHSVNHFKHMLDTDPRSAAALRDQTQRHLKIIDVRMQDALDMLNRVPQYEKKIRMQIEDFKKMYHSIDVSIKGLLSQEMPDDDVDESSEEDLEDNSYEDMVEAPVEPEYEVKTPVANPEVKTETIQKEKDPMPEKPVEPTPPELHHIHLEKTEPLLQVDKFDDEVMENEHDYVEVKHLQHADRAESNKLEVQASYIEKSPMKKLNSIHTGTPLGIAVGSITVFIVIVVGIVVIRKRSQRTSSGGGFVEVDQVTSPEERHVAKMQMNGYENPTYKYFETSPSNA